MIAPCKTIHGHVYFVHLTNPVRGIHHGKVCAQGQFWPRARLDLFLGAHSVNSFAKNILSGAHRAVFSGCCFFLRVSLQTEGPGPQGGPGPGPQGPWTLPHGPFIWALYLEVGPDWLWLWL